MQFIISITDVTLAAPLIYIIGTTLIPKQHLLHGSASPFLLDLLDVKGTDQILVIGLYPKWALKASFVYKPIVIFLLFIYFIF